MSILTATQIESPARRQEMKISSCVILQCPRCSGHISDGASEPRCAACGFHFAIQHGIWRALPPERAQFFRQFIAEYETVRSREGRGSSHPDYYLALPYRDLTGRNAWQWKIRNHSFRFFEGKILPVLEQIYPSGLDVLDLGAGNAWLSYRLSLRGHRPVAVDLLDNDLDGLGAARHFDSRLPRAFARFQAEMDRLPFAASQFDVAVFNASFHYSEDYERTLREALRCLRRPGHIFILDSPLYVRDASGRQMVEERRAAFKERFGFPSDSIPSREYLARATLDQLERAFGLTWKILRPWHGLGWALRPWKARLLGRREPAKFFILWGTVGDT
jgi:SAM-dependent methyltransferase